MMFGHGANPIFFNKRKIERPEHSLPPTPHPHSTPLKVDLHMRITPLRGSLDMI